MKIHFKEITGSAEVFVDGVKAGMKSTREAGPLTVSLPPKVGIRVVTLRVDVGGNPKGGLTGSVGVRPKS